jgi:hypothetical protein
LGKVKNKKGKPPGRETHGALVRQECLHKISKLARLSPNSIFLAATPTCIFEFRSHKIEYGKYGAFSGKAAPPLELRRTPLELVECGSLLWASEMAWECSTTLGA